MRKKSERTETNQYSALFRNSTHIHTCMYLNEFVVIPNQNEIRMRAAINARLGFHEQDRNKMNEIFNTHNSLANILFLFWSICCYRN